MVVVVVGGGGGRRVVEAVTGSSVWNVHGNEFQELEASTTGIQR